MVELAGLDAELQRVARPREGTGKAWIVGAERVAGTVQVQSVARAAQWLQDHEPSRGIRLGAAGAVPKKNNNLQPKDETISFLLNYSKALSVINCNKMKFEALLN